jgi:altronate dehydratase large subunit
MSIRVQGYVRPNGKVGVRNHVLVIPTVVCSAETAVRIADSVEGAVTIYNQHGCCQLPYDVELVERALIGYGKNPNVAAVLVVGLGCESVNIHRVADRIASTGKPVETVIIQEAGGTLKTIERGVSIVKEFVQEAAKIKREEVDISEIIASAECGGSDATSGLVANPVVGYAIDKLIDLGGTAIFSETTEVIGAEHLLARRAASKEVADKLLAVIRRLEDFLKSQGMDIRGSQPTPGNIAGGITTLEEKSLGAIIKAGTRVLQGVLEYGEEPTGKGLYFMDTPGQDIESITGMVAGGAVLVLFTTGRGTPTGCPIAPVIKVTGNPYTYEKMKDNIDFYAAVIEGKETVKEAGERLFNEMIEVINGKPTKSEALKHREFGIYKTLPTI